MKAIFWPGVAMLAGTTIGAGVFGIPYVTAQVGYLVGLLWLLAVAVLILFTNLAYAYIVQHVPSEKPRQFVGYSQLLLGPWGKFFALFVILFSQWGAILAYIIGLGEFSEIIFNMPGRSEFFSILAFAVVAGLTLMRLQILASVEAILTVGMILVVGIIAVVGAPQIDLQNFTSVSLLAQVEGRDILRQFFLPYGVIMTALSGFAVVPEMYHLAQKSNVSSRSFYYSIIIGTCIPVVVYLVFQYVVVGVSGVFTSEEAITGLVPYLQSSVVLLGAIFGSLAMGSSFLSLARVLKDVFGHDFHLDPVLAWCLSLFPPLLLFIAGVNSFIVALELVGVWLGTATTVLICFMLFRATRSRVIS